MNIAVIGGSSCSKKTARRAQELGTLIAGQGWILVCGGQGGVMEAACRGAREANGVTVGILPHNTTAAGNQYLSIKIPTGLGYVRNVLVVRAADVVVALDGKYGTLSEIAFAFNDGKTVLGIDTWDIKGIIKVKTPNDVVKYIKKSLVVRKKNEQKTTTIQI